MSVEPERIWCPLPCAAPRFACGRRKTRVAGPRCCLQALTRGQRSPPALFLMRRWVEGTEGPSGCGHPESRQNLNYHINMQIEHRVSCCPLSAQPTVSYCAKSAQTEPILVLVMSQRALTLPTGHPAPNQVLPSAL